MDSRERSTGRIPTSPTRRAVASPGPTRAPAGHHAGQTVRDPAFPDTFEHIDDGTSSFSIDYSGTSVYEDGSCNGVSTFSGPAEGTFSTYRDPYGRASYLVGQVAAPFGSATFDQNTDFVLLLPLHPVPGVATHRVLGDAMFGYGGSDCHRQCAEQHAQLAPGVLPCDHDADREPGRSSAIGTTLRGAPSSGARHRPPLTYSTATLTVSGVLRPA